MGSVWSNLPSSFTTHNDHLLAINCLQYLLTKVPHRKLHAGLLSKSVDVKLYQMEETHEHSLKPGSAGLVVPYPLVVLRPKGIATISLRARILSVIRLSTLCASTAESTLQQDAVFFLLVQGRMVAGLTSGAVKG